jgi:hypothetical protein
MPARRGRRAFLCPRRMSAMTATPHRAPRTRLGRCCSHDALDHRSTHAQCPADLHEAHILLAKAQDALCAFPVPAHPPPFFVRAPLASFRLPRPSMTPLALPCPPRHTSPADLVISSLTISYSIIHARRVSGLNASPSWSPRVEIKALPNASKCQGFTPKLACRRPACRMVDWNRSCWSNAPTMAAIMSTSLKYCGSKSGGNKVRVVRRKFEEASIECVAKLAPD